MTEQQLFGPRERRWIVVVAVALVLILAGLAGALLFRDDGGGSSAGTFTDPSPSASASDSPSPSPSATSESPSASPTPSPSASPSPAASASRSPSPSPSRSVSRSASPAPFVETRDGRPGWGRPEGGCYQATAPSGGPAPFPDLTLELVLPGGTYRTGNPINAKLRVTNSGTQVRRFTSTDNSDDGVLIQGFARSAYYFTSVTTTVSWEVQPGVAQEYAITVQAEQCGDVSTDPAPPLPPGNYEIVASMAWREGGRSDVWVTPTRSLTLT